MINQKLPGAIAILGQALAIYKQRWSTFLGVMIIPMLMILLFVFLTTTGFLGIQQISLKFTGPAIGLFILLAILFFLTAIITQLWGQTALLYAIKDSPEKIGVIESYRRGWHKIISYFWVSLLTGFITLGGFLLLIVPGIIFAIWFSLALYILITEDLRGMNALLKSREYVKGNWGAVFWRFLFIGLIVLIIYLIPIIFNFLKIPFIEEITNFIIGLFLTPLTTTYGFLVYNHLKTIKREIVFAPTGKQKATFIIIPLLGILLIIASLFTMVFQNLNLAKKRAHDVQRESDISQIRMALERYYMENYYYPSSLNELSPKYLQNLPLDPLTKKSYQYQLSPDGKDYKICAQLEVTKTQECLTPH